MTGRHTMRVDGHTLTELQAAVLAEARAIADPAPLRDLALAIAQATGRSPGHVANALVALRGKGLVVVGARGWYAPKGDN